MQYAIILLPVLLPIAFWAWYHWYKDRHQPEPIPNLVICFLLGIAAAWVSRYMYMALEPMGLRHDAYELASTNLWHLAGYAVFIIGGIEETAKLLPFLLVAIHFRAFDENLDGIIYASFIALGYAAAENIYYIEYLTKSEAMYRGFAGPVVHIVFASIWGYRVGLAKLAGQPLLLTAFVSVTIAALLHGAYDFVVIAFPITALPVSAMLIVAVWVWRLLLIRRIKRVAGHVP